MKKLLIISDDLTGALDTSVQLSKIGAVTKISFDVDNGLDNFTSDIEVMVIDTETRHAEPEQAYSIVYEITKKARELGIKTIFKKTDSAMRGNVGAELQAMLDASNKSRIHFIPSYPQMNRLTINGIHYIDGVEVAESVFANDPFDPVKHSLVSDILNDSYKTKVKTVPTDSKPNSDESGIIVYDSRTSSDIRNTVEMLSKQSEMEFIAGCSGLANILPTFIKFNEHKKNEKKLKEKTIIICGSINPISLKQCEYARGKGIREFIISPIQKLDLNWTNSSEFLDLKTTVLDDLDKNDLTIINANGVQEPNATKKHAKELGLNIEETRERIAGTIGKIGKQIIDEGFEGNVFLMGGDVLFQFLKECQLSTITPYREIDEGIVVSEISYKGRSLNIISKSGGFGSEDIFIKIADLIREESK